ncbi:MAG: hypothetical protein K9N47_20900 [Prosthecobacter sp.]|uniref:hypothetical protein n=1 Tax=Prosthecobacter sp. TaxID=1965333 RepID=UPI002601945F|nr:hypothetical protein [Prosthecobacter sp.]MCF7788594.1 hypothetical protein [Prosthecobacter sp.]
MKTHFCLFLACVSLVSAQDKPKDPFVKDKKAAAAAAAPSPGKEPDADPFAPGDNAAAASEKPKNVQCLIESFTLPQADYAALLDEPGGHDKLHAHLLNAVRADSGTVRLDACHLITTKSGTRSTFECTDELIYPTEWTHADRTGFQYPTAFEMRQMGDVFEFEPTLDPETGSLNITQAFKRDYFPGFRLYKADTTLAGIPVMDVLARSTTSSTRMLPGLPTLIATPKTAQPGGISLVFATLQVITLQAHQATPEPRKGNLILTARVISLERMKGWELLKKHAADGGACLAALKPLLAAKEAALEHIATIVTQPGVRSLHESGLVHVYGTEFSPPTECAELKVSGSDPNKPGAPARPPGLAGTTAHEYRNTGFRLEIEPTASPDGAFADMTLAPEYVSMTGNLKDKNYNEHYPEMPLFSVQKFTAGYTQVIGTTYLIGTMNSPGDTGANEHKDDGRMWLLFMDVDPE